MQIKLGTGRPIAEVARDLGATRRAGQLGNVWRRNDPEPVPDLNAAECARVKDMETKIHRLRMAMGS